ncbi:hypothetical protein [Mesobacillus zeae]|uniref:Uncharacterized protein n=1 Tax=Mesobacillus zeae TaxID=1917180 RepID=A0A398BDJ0_9BACI|nr:hypothetical protein [Mesobacillus zeae]RID85653.1 hypothetical protein D1970_08855 [Mesobacillus zeae]
MKIITSLTFEINMPKHETEAYEALSENERKIRIEAMKEELAEIIVDECEGEAKFTNFTIHVEEGE